MLSSSRIRSLARRLSSKVKATGPLSGCVRRRSAIAAACVLAGTVVVLAAARAEQGGLMIFLPNGVFFPNPGGASQTYNAAGSRIDLTGPFFKPMGTNGRSCGTCHDAKDGMSVSAADIDRRFVQSEGLDPIFRPVDGSNCNHNIDVSTREGRKAAYSLLRTRGLFRISLGVPANADYKVVSVSNPYGCNETDVVSMYRRPLPSTNLRFLSAVMFDGRESSPATGTTKIINANYPASLRADLAHQAMDATMGHAEGDGSRPTVDELQQIVDFEMSLYTAQAVDRHAGLLTSQGAKGGPEELDSQPFFIGINSSVIPLVPTMEMPGGLVTPGDGKYTAAMFHLFGTWASLPEHDPRAAIARGEAIFNSKTINITGVAGLNDDVSEGGLVAGGVPAIQGTCATCHDTPNVGNHSFPTPLDIGTGDPSGPYSKVNMGGLDISYLPTITVCKTDSATGNVTSNCKTTTDLGQALVDGKFDHVGKIKGPILRGLSARAPYFHNGAAADLLDAVRFYENRFGMVLSKQEESDLVAFLSSL
jgi:cytochrome c peroxidase